MDNDFLSSRSSFVTRIYVVSNFKLLPQNLLMIHAIFILVINNIADDTTYHVCENPVCEVYACFILPVREIF